MKKYLFLLCLAAFVSCKKEVIEPVDCSTTTVGSHSNSRHAGKPNTPDTSKSPVTSQGNITISKDANDYNDHVVAGLLNSSMQNISIALIDLTAKKSDTVINQLPVTLIVTNPGSGGTNAGSLISVLRLYNSQGVQIDSENVPVTSDAVVVFRNLNLKVQKGSTDVLTVRGDLNPIDGNIVQIGASVRVDVTSADAQSINASGSTTGSTIFFYANGINVTTTASMGTATASAAGGSQTHDVLGFTIPFSVTAFGQQAYIPSTATAASTASPAHTIQFSIDNANGANQAVGTGVITYTGKDNLTVDTNGNYIIPAGQTKNFQLQITYTANGAASYRASLLNVNWSLTDFSDSNDANVFNAGFNSMSFKTNYVAAQ